MRNDDFLLIEFEFKERIYKRHILEMLKVINSRCWIEIRVIFKSMKLIKKNRDGTRTSHDLSSIQEMFGVLLFMYYTAQHATYNPKTQGYDIDDAEAEKACNVDIILSPVDKELLGDKELSELTRRLKNHLEEHRRRLDGGKIQVW